MNAHITNKKTCPAGNKSDFTARSVTSLSAWSRVFCVVAGLVVSAPVTATAWEAAFDAGSTTQNMVTDSTRFFSSDNRMNGRSLRLGITAKEHVFVEFDWLATESDRARQSTGAGGYTAKLIDDAFTLAARYRMPVASWVEPFARAGAGATRHEVSLTGVGAGYEATNYTPHVLVGVGADLIVSRKSLWRRRPDPKPRFTFGFTIEVGWQHTFGSDLNLERTAALDPPITTDDMKLGTLTMSAFTTRIALCVRL